MPRHLTRLSPLSLSFNLNPRSTSQYSPIPLTSLSRRSGTSRPPTPTESSSADQSSGATTPTPSSSSEMAGKSSKQWSAFQPYSHPHTVYDVESLASPRRLISRKVTCRRVKWLLAIVFLGGTMLYLSDYGVPDVAGVVPGSSGGWSSGQRPPKPDTEDIWGDAGDVEPAPPPPSDAGGKEGGKTGVDAGWVKDEHGDLFRRQPLPPVHPDLSLLPAPSTLFTEVEDISSFLKPPTYEPFPENRLRDIISDPPADEQPRDPSRSPQLPDDAYSETWKAPADWQGERGTVKKVQWEGFSTGRQDTWETKEETAVRHERREAVRRGFVYAWQKYKDHAWGHDEVKPVSKIPSDPFNNWGASIIDTLDTLLVLGLNDEYNLCRPFINQLNYHWVGGKDWQHGYVSADPGAHPDDEDEPANEVWGLPRDKTVRISVFETTIRYLGGLLGAYDLSGDQLLVDRAVDLAIVLKRAFHTLSGLPVGHMEPGYESNYLSIGYLSIAEAASISLEFMRLSQVTGDRQWHDLAQRITDYLEERVIPRSTRGNLIPMSFQVDGAAEMGGTYVWGAMADSYYEYLPKTFKLLGNSKAAQQYRRIYEASADAAKQYLYYPVEIYNWSPAHKDANFLGIGKREQSGQLIHEVEHLTCFAGAMLGLGAKLLDREQDMVDAERFTETCYWLSAATPIGLQPEVVEFYQPGEEVWENVTESGFSYLAPAPGEAGLGEKIEERMKGSPTGSRKVVTRGINRPETIESIFYMYRLTGDRKWQEKGWKMFVSWVSAAKVDGGISSIHDVTRKDFYHSDNMESFMFAETFKYHFLLQSDPDVLSLDDYVLNTEAHPLIANPDIKPGSQRLWTPLPSQDLGMRAQGTDAQKWMRLEHLNRSQRPIGRNAPMAAGGGRGMGGGAYGGGRPDHKPQIPDEFKERFQNMKQNHIENRPRPA